MDFTVFDTKKIDEYSKRAKEQWGKTAEYKEFEKKSENWTDAEPQELMNRLIHIFAEFSSKAIEIYCNR